MRTQQGAYPVQRRASIPINCDLEEDDSYYETRPRTSTRRYVNTNGQQVIQQGNRRLVIHNGPPPARKLHWSFILGIGMLLTLGLWISGSYALNGWTNYQLDSTYGIPRTFQTDQVVGHDDSADHPTHFIFVNLREKITIIEIPGGNSAHARIYSGPTLYSDNGDQTPVTGEFEDVNGDGKIDMIVHIGTQRIVYLNNGTQFKTQQWEKAMQTVDEKSETIHLYVVREEIPKPSLFPVLLSGLTLSLLLIYCILAPYRQPELRAVIRVPAAFLPIQNFGISIAVIPTGRKTYVATSAHGALALYNGSIITQQIPQGMILTSTQGVEVVVEDTVVVPAGNAPNFGIAWVTTHALVSGKRGNIPAYGVNTVINSSIYIRNLQRFTGGRDAYSVKIVTPQDRQTALGEARSKLGQSLGEVKAILAYPCKEVMNGVVKLVVKWSCQFYTYSVSPIIHITHVQLSGKTVIVDGFIVVRPRPFTGK